MRRLLTFECAGEALSASIDGPESSTGLLMVTGGSQTRTGSHRMYERLAKILAEQGYPCFRYDRRGVGDSTGEDPGFDASGPDVQAAAAAFRQEVPGLRNVIGFGLCDGATALALHGRGARLSGLVLVNPWFVEAEAGAPAPAAVRAHYRQRLLSPDAWKRLLRGGVNLGKLARGVRKAGSRSNDALAARAAAALSESGSPVALILATGDATAAAAAAEIKRPAFAKLIRWRRDLDTDSHTFARQGDEENLAAAVADALGRLAR